MKKNGFITQLTVHNALHQSTLAIVLISVIPVLSIIHMGSMVWFHADKPSPYTQNFILASVIILGVSGFLILLKFLKNIIRLRLYIEDVVEGVLPENISLLNIHSSDDLKFIEHGLNMVLQQMRQRIEFAEKQHRAMAQSLGAACHHISQPATILKMRLYLMKQVDIPQEERAQVDACEKDFQAIMDLLNKLRTVTEFRTESYIHEDDGDEAEILAV